MGGGWGESRREHGPSIHHLKGARPRGFLGKARTLRRTIGKSLVQSRCASRDSLVGVSDYSIHPFYLS